MRPLYIMSFLLIYTKVYGLISPDKIVEMADHIRNPANSYVMQIEVKTPDSTSLFEVYLKGKEKTLIVTQKPERDQGRNMLMLDRDFYAYVPNLKRSVRLSLAQKLSGQVANGDIARTRWAGDYTPTLEKETPEIFQVLLKAKKENLTYAWIRLWVQKNNFFPQKANYLSLDGKTILKTSYFEDYKQFEGKLRPGTIRIEDIKKETSYIRVIKMTSQDLEDSLFNEKNLGNQR